MSGRRSSLDRSGGEARDDLALEDHDQDEEGGGGREVAKQPIMLLPHTPHTWDSVKLMEHVEKNAHPSLKASFNKYAVNLARQDLVPRPSVRNRGTPPCHLG